MPVCNPVVEFDAEGSGLVVEIIETAVEFGSSDENDIVVEPMTVAGASVPNVVDTAGPDDQIASLFVLYIIIFPLPTTNDAPAFPAVWEFHSAEPCIS